MNRSFNATVITPYEYDNGSEHFSVIYMLHSYSGDFRTWSQLAPLGDYADRYHLLFVCPDGNYNSWYLDSPIRQDSKFESYIAVDVVSFIDAHFRTWANVHGRALIGSSMGGHGAVTILAKHPDIFCGAGSISGIMDLTEFPTQWDIHEVLGDYQSHADSWRASSFLTLCDKLVGLNKAIILDCGTSDFALRGNRAAHEKLTALGIAHQYFERPGSHVPSYVRRNVEAHVMYFDKILLPPGK